jgi:hypothetical protein
MLKKAFIGVLVVALFSIFLIVGINFNVSKAVDHGGSGTLVGGIICENTTWTLESNPYLFVDHVTVAWNATLTIEPGVMINLDLWSLIIEGTLYARGNESHKIVFQSHEKPLNAWPPRIYFYESSTHWNETTNEGCILEYALINVTNYQYETIFIQSGSSPKISNNVIFNYGNEAGAIRVQGGVVTNNTIIGGSTGIVLGSGSILYNVIQATQYGILLGIKAGFSYYSDIVGNLLADNWVGIGFCSPIYPCITNNTIVKNTYGFDIADYDVNGGIVTIVYNNIHSNEYDVRVRQEDPRITINMTFNWWGTTNTSLIDKKIYDQNDNRRLSIVNYTFFLAAPAYFPLDVTSPSTIHDYDFGWHASDFTISLNAFDNVSGVAEIYYKINNGPVESLSINGQPFITTESANNTLEYWSADYAGNEEFPHKLLTGIKLDKTHPTIGMPSRVPEGDVQPNQEVKVSVNVTDAISGVKNVALSYNLDDSEVWIDLPMTFNMTTGFYEAIIPGPNETTVVKYRIIAYDNTGNQGVEDNSGQYYVYTVIPEVTSTLILLMLMLTTLIATVLQKKKRKTKPQLP